MRNGLLFLFIFIIHCLLDKREYDPIPDIMRQLSHENCLEDINKNYRVQINWSSINVRY